MAHQLATHEPTPSYPRGPPRKPKQSGHALWVGNLPPGTTVIDLKDQFSREATKDIESLFLISKSNCAFVNYRTEAACSAAMNRFHDSRFNGVRLVCRLRRGSVATNSPSTVPQPDRIPDSPTKLGDSAVVQVPNGVNEDTITVDPVLHIPEKYFIVKSLTLQDLDASVRNGVWATQSHNEATLNKAFESADNVYLIFSANKSGEYFGYARMASPISSKAVAINPQRLHVEAAEMVGETDGPKSIPTPATEWAPEGRIVDDSARGTIFWEAQLPANADEPVVHEEEDSTAESKQGQDWGKPFKLEWLSTNRLPFYRTRGLRNPWNANREVKIARDGTELEPSIGKRLVQMFHRPVAPVMPHGIIGIVPMHPQFQPY
ncbi:YT521-B-like domain-containing protein [Delphinella strobiligena]|nr:YT521-B-like domain-containing protein [Delphinella strobiligena]